MNDRNLMILSGMIGAAVGVGVGYALFTERGRRLRAELQPEIESVVREAVRLAQMVDDVKKARPAAPAATVSGAATWRRRTP
jgi:type II secretory pathway component PulM